MRSYEQRGRYLKLLQHFILSVQYVTWCNWHTLKNAKYLFEICTAGWNWTACLRFKKIILSLLLYLQMVLFISEQLHFRVGEFLDERPACGPKYKAIWIPTSLWIALQKGATMVPAYECEDPLCRWMFMSCTPDHTLSIQRVPGANGTSDWCIGNLTAGYLESVRQPRNVGESPMAPVRSEVAQRLMEYDYYQKMEPNGV